MRSIYNHVARELMVGHDWTWQQICRALAAAHLAVDCADLYRATHSVA